VFDFDYSGGHLALHSQTGLKKLHFLLSHLRWMTMWKGLSLDIPFGSPQNGRMKRLFLQRR